jgi:hypothetical protein
MDFKTIREQILNNLEQFDPSEMKVIILKLLDFNKELEIENQTLKAERDELLENVEALQANKIDEDYYKAKVDEIIDLAQVEAEKIVNSAKDLVEERLEAIDAQGRKYIYELLIRMENIVKDLQNIDEEAKLYRLHILTIFKKTIFKFSESDYHILKIDDDDLRKLMSFYQEDDSLQVASDQIMQKLEHFEHYLHTIEAKKLEDHPIQLKEIEEKLHQPFVLETDKELKEEVPLINNQKQEIIEDEKEETSQDDESLELITEDEEIVKFEEKQIKEEPVSDHDTKFLDIFNKYSK